LSFRSLSVGKLTKKQEKTVTKITRICFAFYEKGNIRPVPRTWNELESKSKVSKGFLSVRLRELISQGVVRAESKVDARGKLCVFYTYTGEVYEIEGKMPEPSSIPAARIYHDKSGIKAVKLGYMKKKRPIVRPTLKRNIGKAKDRYFAEDGRGWPEA
jgi:hypothetical protein